MSAFRRSIKLYEFQNDEKTKLKSIRRKRDQKAVLHLDVDRRQCVGWRVIPRADYAHVKIVPDVQKSGTSISGLISFMAVKGKLELLSHVLSNYWATN